MLKSFWTFVFSSIQILDKCNQAVSPVKLEMQNWNPTILSHVTEFKSYPIPKDLWSILTNLFPSAFTDTRNHKKLQLYEEKCSYTCFIAVLPDV